MATISFYESGKSQNGPPITEKSLDWCVEHLGLRPSGRIADLETKLTIGEKEVSIQAPIGGFRFAVVRVDENDIQEKNDWKTGLYLLEKNATQVRAILNGTQPEVRKNWWS